MSGTPVVLGIDAGTTAVKTVAFSATGQVITLAREQLLVTRGERGEAEADMDALWSAVASTLRQVTARLAGYTVVAIGVTGQGDGAWLVNGDGNPIRSAALWLDGRGAHRVDEWVAAGKAAAVHSVTGSLPFPGTLPILWDELGDSEPERRETAVTQLNCKDWIRFRLTGERATDPSDASRGYLDLQSGRYSDELISRLGHENIRHVLAPINSPAEVAGVVSSPLAQQLGLEPGIPVVTGLVDTAASGLGIGAIDDGASFLVLGTTALLGVNHASASRARSEFSIVIRTGRGSQVLEALASMTGTPNLDWARTVLGLGDQDWRDVEKLAAQVPRGSNGVVFLPYSSPSGERAPFLDTAASASWHGMSLQTDRAALLRSVYEGLAYSIRESLESLGHTTHLAIAGGGSESTLLCRIVADVLGIPVDRPASTEVGAKGVAAIAAVAAGLHPDLSSAIASMSGNTTRFTPSSAAQLDYEEHYRAFLDTRELVRPGWGTLRALRQRVSPTTSTESLSA